MHVIHNSTSNPIDQIVMHELGSAHNHRATCLFLTNNHEFNAPSSQQRGVPFVAILFRLVAQQPKSKCWQRERVLNSQTPCDWVFASAFVSSVKWIWRTWQYVGNVPWRGSFNAHMTPTNLKWTAFDTTIEGSLRADTFVNVWSPQSPRGLISKQPNN